MASTSSRADLGVSLRSGAAPSRFVYVGPASRRWAAIVAGLVRLNVDIRTLDEWGSAIGMSRGAIKCRCANAGVTAKDSLAFARLLTAVRQHADVRWYPRDLLDIVDPRTLRRLLDRARIDPATERAPSVDQFLQQQTLVTAQPLMAALREHLKELPTASG